MQYSFKFFQSYNDKGHFGSAMDMRTKLMGYMEVGLLVDTGQIELT